MLENVSKIIAEILPFGLEAVVGVTFPYQREELSYPSGFWVVISLIILILILISIGTVLTSINFKSKSLLVDSIIAFSFPQNFTKLLKVSNQEDQTLKSLNGIRVCAMSLVLIGHSYSMITTGVVFNLMTMTSFLQAKWIAIIVTATFAVDAFFFLSGFLSFLLLSYKIEKTKIWMLYMH